MFRDHWSEFDEPVDKRSLGTFDLAIVELARLADCLDPGLTARLVTLGTQLILERGLCGTRILVRKLEGCVVRGRAVTMRCPVGAPHESTRAISER